MRTVTALVFDDVIVGTGTTWYTSDEFNDLLTRGDCFAAQLCTTKVSGSSPTITVVGEHSEDSEHWLAIGAGLTSAITEGEPLIMGADGFFPVLLSRLRIRISLGGTNPRCHLKLYVTMRVFSTERVAQAPQQALPAQPARNRPVPMRPAGAGPRPMPPR
jgi:hypothetical protein